MCSTTTKCECPAGKKKKRPLQFHSPFLIKCDKYVSVCVRAAHDSCELYTHTKKKKRFTVFFFFCVTEHTYTHKSMRKGTWSRFRTRPSLPPVLLLLLQSSACGFYADVIDGGAGDADVASRPPARSDCPAAHPGCFRPPSFALCY